VNGPSIPQVRHALGELLGPASIDTSVRVLETDPDVRVNGEPQGVPAGGL
jgi:hypothetical protein